MLGNIESVTCEEYRLFSPGLYMQLQKLQKITNSRK